MAEFAGGAGILLSAVFISMAPPVPAAFGAGESGGPQAGPVLIQGATIWTMGEQGVLQDADLLLDDGKVIRVGQGLSAPRGAEIIDGRGKHVTPGLIDAHSHTAAAGGVNEGSNNITAEVRIRDIIDSEDIAIYRQLAGGLTTANVLHGSANSIGGQNAVIKLRWPEPAEALLFEEAPQGIKFALGENPKRSNFRRPGMPQRYPNTRMGVAASIRGAFLEAREYQKEWKAYEKLSDQQKSRAVPPRTNLQLDALVEILEGKRLVHSHSYRQDEILMLLRVAEEFGFRIATFQHVLEGYKVADELAEHGAGASTFSDWWGYKAEAYDAIPYNGALMTERGVVVSFNSDSSELARRMNLEAAKGVKYGGMSEVDALALVTINPARQLRIDKWVGSLEKGKSADVALWSGHPLSTLSICEKTWVDGVKRFDRAEDLAGRPDREAERASLIEQIEQVGKPAKKDKKEESAGEDESGEPAGEEAGDQAEEAAGTETAPQPGPTALAYATPGGWATGTIALVGGTVHPASGPAMAGATILIEGPRIKAVGAGVAVPDGAEQIDASGRHIYPGLIDADTVVGLVEINSVAGTVDTSETGRINPEARVELAVNPDSTLIPVTRANGITHVLTAPRGGLFSGTSSLTRLAGWTWEDLSAAAPAALHMEYPSWRPGFSFVTFSLQSEEEVKKQREEAFDELKKFLAGARAYLKAREAEEKGGSGEAVPRRDPALEAMIPVLQAKVPVVVHARELRQIKHAVEWAEKEGLRIIIAGGNDAWRVAGMLKEREIPVILGPILANPTRRHEAYDTPFTAAGKLHEAGVLFAISTGGSTFGAANTRNLPYHAAMAAAFGLDPEEAIRAVTLSPARILGVDGDLGSIEPGKSASLVVADGDILDIRTRIRNVYVDGKQVDLMNKHKRLYEKYRSRPRKAR